MFLNLVNFVAILLWILDHLSDENGTALIIPAPDIIINKATNQVNNQSTPTCLSYLTQANTLTP
jgi:hypothetical protein